MTETLSSDEDLPPPVEDVPNLPTKPSGCIQASPHDEDLPSPVDDDLPAPVDGASDLRTRPLSCLKALPSDVDLPPPVDDASEADLPSPDEGAPDLRTRGNLKSLTTIDSEDAAACRMQTRHDLRDAQEKGGFNGMHSEQIKQRAQAAYSICGPMPEH